MYSPSAWFWQVFVLTRRTVFVTVSVQLVRSAGDRNLAFALAHLASLLVQMQFRPFQSNFFNSAESAFHVLLIVLSMTMSVKVAPLHRGTEIVLFLLIVPPLAIYAIVAAVRHALQHRSRRSQSLEGDATGMQPTAEKQQPGRLSLTGISVELKHLPSPSSLGAGAILPVDQPPSAHWHAPVTAAVAAAAPASPPSDGAVAVHMAPPHTSLELGLSHGPAPSTPTPTPAHHEL